MKKKEILKIVVTIILGLCIALARIVYPTHVDITKMTVVIEFLMEFSICALIVLINLKDVKEILMRKDTNKGDFISNAILVFVAMIFGSVIITLLFQTVFNALSSVPFDKIYDPAAAVSDLFQATFFLPVMLVQCIIAPIEEELVFRYTFRKVFPKNNIIHIILYVIVSAWLFAFIHIGNPISPALVTYASTGIILAIAYLKLKDIRYLMVGHALNNILIWIRVLLLVI